MLQSISTLSNAIGAHLRSEVPVSTKEAIDTQRAATVKQEQITREKAREDSGGAQKNQILVSIVFALVLTIQAIVTFKWETIKAAVTTVFKEIKMQQVRKEFDRSIRDDPVIRRSRVRNEIEYRLARELRVDSRILHSYVGMAMGSVPDWNFEAVRDRVKIMLSEDSNGGRYAAKGSMTGRERPEDRNERSGERAPKSGGLLERHPFVRGIFGRK